MLDESDYPSPAEILTALGEECVLVGSATTKPLQECKDLDFVISKKGLSILQRWNYFLTWDSPNWAVLIPYACDDHKTIEFFGEIATIEDPAKWANRITYDDAVERDLKVTSIYGIEVFSL